MTRAIRDFDIVLLDQRGTGKSSPITLNSLQKVSDSSSGQASFLAHFRADSIVRDCEKVKEALKIQKWGAILGQSFGGFCLTTYLSLFPNCTSIGLFTGGLPPVGTNIDDIYRSTYERCIVRNQRYFDRYPADAAAIKQIYKIISANPVKLPSGGYLTPERFQQLGLSLGMQGSYERIHYLLSNAFEEGDDCLSYYFLRDFESEQSFDTNIIYALLHEAIYCEGGQASNWSAERVKEEEKFKHCFDFGRCLADEGDSPIYFTGKAEYPFVSHS